jgi:DNA-binding transcriptional LysR family regulator
MVFVANWISFADPFENSGKIDNACAEMHKQGDASCNGMMHECFLRSLARDHSVLPPSGLGVQHSTVSRRIHALEQELATPLIERSTTGYILTDAGEELKNSALRIERELLSFEAVSAGLNDDPSGELRVTAIANMASTVLMPLFAEFSAAYPNIDLRVEVTNDSVRLADRDADVALRQTNAPGETLIGTRLTTVASAVYGSVGYCSDVKAGKVPEKWIGVDCCEYHRAWTKQARPQADHSFCVDDTSLTAAALREGLGVGYLPCFMGDSDPTLVRFREPEKQHELGCGSCITATCATRSA